MIIKIVLYLFLLATSLPVGLFLAWLCDDELIKDRKYFFMLSWFLIICAFSSYIFYFKASIIFSIVYILFVILILIRRGRAIENKLKTRKKTR